MSTETILTDVPASPVVAAAGPNRTEWFELVLTALFTASAVLFVSFLAVVAGLV